MESPPESLEAILANPDAIGRSEHFARLARKVPDNDIARILREIDPALWETSYALILLKRWTILNPHEVSAWALDRPSGEARQRLINVIAYTWADTDFSASLRWAQRLDDPTERTAALHKALESGMHAHPRLALQEAEALPDSPELRLLISSCLQQWAGVSPQDAAAWARQHTDETARNEALTHVVQSWARTDPTAAADFALAEIGDDRALQKAVVAVVSRGRANDPTLIRAWIDEFPAGPIRTAAEAEWNRGHTIFEQPPASMPGEDIEDRSPPSRE